MPARSLRAYLILDSARGEGLAFPYPPWWDVERLFAQEASYRIALPSREEALVLPASIVRTWNRSTERWEESVPRRATPAPGDTPNPESVRQALVHAEWLVLHSGWVWVAAEGAGLATAIIWPYWWGAGDVGWGAPWLWERLVQDTSNQIDVNYVGLISGQEARELNEVHERAFEAWKASYRQRPSRHDRRQMAQFRRLLKRTVWVVLYWYEWESGLD